MPILTRQSVHMTVFSLFFTRDLDCKWSLHVSARFHLPKSRLNFQTAHHPTHRCCWETSWLWNCLGRSRSVCEVTCRWCWGLANLGNVLLKINLLLSPKKQNFSHITVNSVWNNRFHFLFDMKENMMDKGLKNETTASDAEVHQRKFCANPVLLTSTHHTVY